MFPHIHFRSGDLRVVSKGNGLSLHQALALHLSHASRLRFVGAGSMIVFFLMMSTFQLAWCVIGMMLGAIALGVGQFIEYRIVHYVLNDLDNLRHQNESESEYKRRVAHPLREQVIRRLMRWLVNDGRSKIFTLSPFMMAIPACLMFAMYLSTLPALLPGDAQSAPQLFFLSLLMCPFFVTVGVWGVTFATNSAFMSGWKDVHMSDESKALAVWGVDQSGRRSHLYWQGDRADNIMSVSRAKG